jgi:uncharacterized sulfatase
MNKYMEAAPTLPRILGRHGYVSFQAGKWWQGNYTRGGFTHGMTRGERHGDDGLTIGRKTMQPVFDFIDASKKDGKPFFVWYAPMMPHNPHNPPKRLLEKYQDKTPSIHVAKYFAMCEWFDETVGQLLEHLDKQGIAENTIVVFMADNGWIQDPEKEEFAERSKQSPNEGGIRTPIMIRWLGKVPPRMADEPISSIDIATTFLKAVGIERPKMMQGIDLLDDAAVKSRGPVFGECYTHTAVDLTKPESSLRWRWVVDADWKLILPSPNESNSKPALYNLSRDPHEQTDLSSQDPDRVKALAGKIDGWWKPATR